MTPRLATIVPVLLLAACNSGTADAPGALQTSTFDSIAADEVVYYAGTEPFWGGSAGADLATYSTPEMPDGTQFPIKRFAGNNGLGISGKLDNAAFDLTITPGQCTDGMSDRTYPFAATLMIGAEQREGCAWTDDQPFTGPEIP